MNTVLEPVDSKLKNGYKIWQQINQIMACPCNIDKLIITILLGLRLYLLCKQFYAFMYKQCNFELQAALARPCYSVSLLLCYAVVSQLSHLIRSGL